MMLGAVTKRITAAIRFIEPRPVEQNHGQLCICFLAD